jgi:hypothetical protein
VLKVTGVAKFIAKLQSNPSMSQKMRDACAEVVSEWREQVKEDNKASTISALKGGCLVDMMETLPTPDFIPIGLWKVFKRDYNSDQLCAIHYVCKPLSTTQDTRISLVQGPPGNDS